MSRSLTLLATTVLCAPAFISAYAEDLISTTPTVPVNVATSTTTPTPFIISNAAREIFTTLTLAESHPTIASSAANVEQARGTLRAARGSRWFTLTGDAEAGAQSYDEEGNNGSSGVGNAGLSFNQPLTDGGRRRGAVLSASERLAGATDNHDWQKRLRRYTAAAAHINLWLAQELVRNNADNVNQLEEIVTEVRGRLSNSEATITEIAEAESRLATARAAQAERLTAWGSAQAAYLRDVGEPANRVATPGTGVSVTTAATSLHPLVASARHAVQEASGIVKQRNAAYYPTLDLRSRVSRNAFAGTAREDDATQGQLTLNLGYTFMDNGVTSGETAAARAARKAAEADLATTELEVEAARLSAQSNATEAERRLTESTRAQEENDRVITNLMHEVKNGNRTVRDLLDARRDQLAAANAWSQAFANRVLSTYDVERWQ